MVRTSRVRADTTVVPANVAYPTDSGLLAKAVRRIGVNVTRIQAAGGAVRTKVRDRSRSAGTKAHGIAARLRSRAQLGRDEAKTGVQKITGELAGLAQAAVTDARKLTNVPPHSMKCSAGAPYGMAFNLGQQSPIRSVTPQSVFHGLKTAKLEIHHHETAGQWVHLHS